MLGSNSGLRFPPRQSDSNTKTDTQWLGGILHRRAERRRRLPGQVQQNKNPSSKLSASEILRRSLQKVAGLKCKSVSFPPQTPPNSLSVSGHFLLQWLSSILIPELVNSTRNFPPNPFRSFIVHYFTPSITRH